MELFYNFYFHLLLLLLFLATGANIRKEIFSHAPRYGEDKKPKVLVAMTSSGRFRGVKRKEINICK
jgi:hypothetical protein